MKQVIQISLWPDGAANYELYTVAREDGGDVDWAREAIEPKDALSLIVAGRVPVRLMTSTVLATTVGYHYSPVVQIGSTKTAEPQLPGDSFAKLFRVHFQNGQPLDCDVAEFEPDGIGEIIDRLTKKHGPVVNIVLQP